MVGRIYRRLANGREVYFKFTALLVRDPMDSTGLTREMLQSADNDVEVYRIKHEVVS